jgi:uncharacterized membrane protein YqjE
LSSYSRGTLTAKKANTLDTLDMLALAVVHLYMADLPLVHLLCFRLLLQAKMASHFTEVRLYVLGAELAA